MLLFLTRYIKGYQGLVQLGDNIQCIFIDSSSFGQFLKTFQARVINDVQKYVINNGIFTFYKFRDDAPRFDGGLTGDSNIHIFMYANPVFWGWVFLMHANPVIGIVYFILCLVT